VARKWGIGFIATGVLMGITYLYYGRVTGTDEQLSNDQKVPIAAKNIHTPSIATSDVADTQPDASIPFKTAKSDKKNVTQTDDPAVSLTSDTAQLRADLAQVDCMTMHAAIHWIETKSGLRDSFADKQSQVDQSRNNASIATDTNARYTDLHTYSEDTLIQLVDAGNVRAMSILGAKHFNKALHTNEFEQATYYYQQASIYGDVGAILSLTNIYQILASRARNNHQDALFHKYANNLYTWIGVFKARAKMFGFIAEMHTLSNENFDEDFYIQNAISGEDKYQELVDTREALDLGPFENAPSEAELGISMNSINKHGEEGFAYIESICGEFDIDP